MKLYQIFKFLGVAAGILAMLLILAGVIGRFSGEFLGVKNFTWFFWIANTFFLFGIFGILGYMAFKEKPAEF